MNNETKYKYINNLPKEYHRVIWDIMIKAESNKFVSECEKLTKKDCKLIMKYLYRITTENKRLKEYQESYRKELDYWKIQFSNKEDIINKAIEYIENHKLDFKQGTTTFGSERLTMEERKLIDILKGEDNE